MTHCKICTDKVKLTEDEVRYQRTRKYCDECAGMSTEDRFITALANARHVLENDMMLELSLLEDRLNDLIEATNENLEITNHRLTKLEESKITKVKSKSKSSE